MGQTPDAVGDRYPLRSLVGRVATAVDQLASAQKPGGGVPAYMRWVNRSVARRIAAVSYVAGLSPDAVTWISLLWSVLAMAMLLFVPAVWWAGVIIAILLATAFAFDSADGQLARLTGRSGARGEWLDHVVDSLRTPALHVVVACAVWVKFGNIALAVLALVMALSLSTQFMSQMLAEQLIRRSAGPQAQRRGGNRQSWILLPTDPGIWAWMFVLWGFPPVFAVAYGLMSALNFVHVGVSLRRRYRDLSVLQKVS